MLTIGILLVSLMVAFLPVHYTRFGSVNEFTNFVLFSLILLLAFCGLYYLLVGIDSSDEIRDEQYHSFISRAPMAVAMLDKNMNYIAVSDRWCTQYDLAEKQDLIGRNHYDVFPEIQQKPEWKEMHKKSLEGKYFVNDEDVFIRKDGSKHYIRRAVGPWYLPNNEVGGLLIYTEDISDIVRAREQAASHKKRLEQEVRERTQKLEQANKDLEAFSYSVSHDLRTPLRAITGFSQILLEEHVDELSAEGRRLLNIVIDNTEKMGTLIDDILAFSRVSRTELVKTEVDLKQLFEDAAQTVMEGYSEIKDRVEFEIQELPKAKGDLSFLKQVAVNLVSNAIKYSSKEETIQVEVGFKQDDQRPTYYVRDNGVGFDMKYSDKLFGVFERLHSSADFEGTGVGLSLVERIIERHDGKIWANGKKGEGATFFFKL
ncbi:MAG TPA: ATP-binding protein [Balneolaceae bacterium]|nr:ATP-binding protein [Balneolaceae bacterium]